MAPSRPVSGALNRMTMSDMSMTSPATMALMAAAMMVAMMLPSIAPVLLSHHRHLRAARVAHAGEHTVLVAIGYGSVWAAIGVGLFALSTQWSFVGSRSAAEGVAVMIAGLLQCSRWKANRLRRCRESCGPTHSHPRTAALSLRDGCGLGVDCFLSCAAPMIVLFASGLMDLRVMAIVTAAITAERVAPDGVRLARITGALALAVGSTMCARSTIHCPASSGAISAACTSPNVMPP